MKTFKNTLYLLFGCTILLTSCQQEDGPDVNKDAADRRIVFHSSLPELASRASSITTELSFLNLTAFDVSDNTLFDGGKLKEYFSDKKLEKDANSSKFTSDQCIWPKPGQEDDVLHFFAYYPALPASASLENRSTVSGATPTVAYRINNYNVAEDIAEQVDFVTAFATGTMDDNLFSGVDLEFRHQLSRVEVQAKGEYKSADIEVAGVSFGKAIMEGTFDFHTTPTSDGVWTPAKKDNTTYIFRPGDEIVAIGAEAVSIMGRKLDSENDNCAMLIPGTCAAWDYTADVTNTREGLYLNVLLRVIDATPTTGKGQQRYPYTDNSQGLNSPNIEVVPFAVGADGKTVVRRLYKKSGNYFTDKDCTAPYTATTGESVKEFGWAAVPVSANWQPGYTYTYTLDYSYGVGVHCPETPGSVAPMAGDPIFSDKVGVSLGFKDWQSGGTSPIVIPGN